MAAAFYRDLQPEDLPIPNKQLMQLIQYSLREDAEVETLTRLISVNPGLTAQVLGLVNSAFFGLRQEVKTISDAVISMGIKCLRNLVLCFAVKEALSKKKIPGFDIDTFWEDSIRRGVAAQQIGYLVNGPIEEAFTAGMLQDVGLLVLFFLEPDKTDRWLLLRSNIPQKRYEMEEELFHTTHDSLGAILAKRWNLPKSYTRAIGYHHLFFTKKETKKFGKVGEKSILAAMMYLADLCNAIYTCHDKSEALTELKQKARLFFGLSDDKVESLLALLPNQVEEMSQSLKVTVGFQTTFETVMEQANRKLVDDNLSYQELTWRLQHSLKERDEYAEKLENELGVARDPEKPST